MSKSSKASKQRASSTRREQLRAQQLADARRQKTTMAIIFAVTGVLLLGVIAVISVVSFTAIRERRAIQAAEAANQITPPNANADGSGIMYNPTNAGDDVPLLSIYEDFQCPACKSTEETYGATINELAKAGTVRLEYKIVTFLDQNLRNDSSFRAARAAACADVVGKFKEYHDVVFPNQPQEGAGYTDQVLRADFAEQAGITGADLTKFQACYDGNATKQWVTDAENKARTTWEGSTPQIDINNKSAEAVDESGNAIPDGQGGNAKWWRGLDPTVEAWTTAINKYK